MIYSVSHRTDVPAFYTSWFMNRIHEKYVMVRNPYYPEKVSTYDLSPEAVDAFLFISKNYAPLLPYAEELIRDYACMFSYTITPYGTDVEPYVPSAIDSINIFKQLSNIVGRKRIDLFYDPIFKYGVYDIEYHKRCFAYMLNELDGYTERVHFSFINMYEKVKRNFVGVEPLNPDEERLMILYMADLCRQHGMVLKCCPGQAEGIDVVAHHIDVSGCSTVPMIAEANGVAFKEKIPKSMTDACGCVHRKDVGVYNTCFHACKYCYANESVDIAWYREMYDEHSPMLYDKLNGDEIISNAKQVMLKK